MEKIGSGKARDVYALDEDTVVKVARCEEGVDCNRREWRIWHTASRIRKILVPCIDISEDGKKLIQKRGKPVDDVPAFPRILSGCNVEYPKQWVEIQGRALLADYGCPRLDERNL